MLVGDLHGDRVRIAAHLGDPVCVDVIGGTGRLQVVCQRCKNADEAAEKTGVPRPPVRPGLHLVGQPSPPPPIPHANARERCDRCREARVYVPPADLIRFVQNPDIEIPVPLLVQWAVDCAEHAGAECRSQSAKDAVYHYLKTGERQDALRRNRGRPVPRYPHFRRRQDEPRSTDLERHARALHHAWPRIVHGLTESMPAQARSQLAMSVSYSYQGKGNTAAERDYQRDRLVRLLLDDSVVWDV